MTDAGSSGAPPFPGDLAFLGGGGAMGARIREYDWTTTSLGPPATWPDALRTTLYILLTTNHPAFIFWGADLVCFYNDAYSRSLGPEKHPSMLGQKGTDVWREIWDIIGPQIEHVMQGRGATWNENQLVPIIRHGGPQEVYWTYGYSPIYDRTSASGVGGVLVLCTETTEQVKSATRLQEAETRWRSLFDQAPGFVAIMTGPRHVFEFANPNYFAIVGRSDFIGQPVAQALPWAAEQGFVGLLDEVYRTGVAYSAYATEIHIPRADGGPSASQYLDFVYQPIRNESGEVTGVFVLGFDSTEKHRAEQALRASEDRLRVACEAAELGIFDYDLVRGELQWDARIAGIWGVDCAPQLAFDALLAGVHPDDRPAARVALERAIDPGGDGNYFAEFRVIDRRGGRTQWVQSTARTSFVDGRATRMIGTVRDISVQKENERRRDEFLATLGHELRNPLAPIANAAHILQQKADDVAIVRKAQQLIARQLGHMTHLIDDLLDVVRVSRGRIELRKRVVQVSDIVDAAIEIAAPMFARRKLPLETRFAADSPACVNGDPTRLSQVVANLIINACKYSEPSEPILLVVERDEGAAEAVIRVTDRGIGIAPEYLGQIFEMFSQAEGSISRSEGGLGIGLALAKGLVDLHGGKLTAQSAGLDTGSTFEVRLPIVRDQAPARPAVEAFATGGRLTGRSVLVVDDNRDAALTLATILDMEGAEVSTAFDGPQALALAAQGRPHSVILDLGLPGMNGYEVCRELRAQPWGRDLQIIALTGFGLSSDRLLSSESGFDAHLVKPVAPAALLEALGAGR